MCKPDNRKWLIVTGGLLAVIITLSVILAVTLSGRASGASGARDPANLRRRLTASTVSLCLPLTFQRTLPDGLGFADGRKHYYSRNRQHQRGSRRGGPQRLSEHHLRRGILHYTVDDHQIYQHLPTTRRPGIPATGRETIQVSASSFASMLTEISIKPWKTPPS